MLVLVGVLVFVGVWVIVGVTVGVLVGVGVGVTSNSELVCIWTKIDVPVTE